MITQIDLNKVHFELELGPLVPSPYCLCWPQDSYHDLLTPPIKIVQMEAARLVETAKALDPSFPDVTRVARLKAWFKDAAAGARSGWPALPVLYRAGDQFSFVDGRHRCKALEELGVHRVPVILG